MLLIQITGSDRTEWRTASHWKSFWESLNFLTITLLKLWYWFHGCVDKTFLHLSDPLRHVDGPVCLQVCLMVTFSFAHLQVLVIEAPILFNGLHHERRGFHTAPHSSSSHYKQCTQPGTGCTMEEKLIRICLKRLSQMQMEAALTFVCLKTRTLNSMTWVYMTHSQVCLIRWILWFWGQCINQKPENSAYLALIPAASLAQTTFYLKRQKNINN